jgi:hypothetical protein
VVGNFYISVRSAIMMKRLTVLVVAGAAILISGGVQGQDVFSDLVRERVDEHRLRHDYRVMHRDQARGNTAAVQYDMQRIRQDQAILARDQAQLNYDRNGRGPQSPNVGYSGSYPSGGGAGYPSPIQSLPPLRPSVQQPMLQPVPLPPSPSIAPPLNPLPGGAGLVPPNPFPGVPQTVGISNPASTGVTLNYVFGGQTYAIDSGRTQEFTVMAPTMMVINRGGQTGVARYLLTGGNTFEFQSDSSGWFVAQKRLDLAALPQDAVPLNPAGNPSPVPAPAPNSPPPLSPLISQP